MRRTQLSCVCLYMLPSKVSVLFRNGSKWNNYIKYFINSEIGENEMNEWWLREAIHPIQSMKNENKKNWYRIGRKQQQQPIIIITTNESIFRSHEKNFPMDFVRQCAFLPEAGPVFMLYIFFSFFGPVRLLQFKVKSDTNNQQAKSCLNQIYRYSAGQSVSVHIHSALQFILLLWSTLNQTPKNQTQKKKRKRKVTHTHTYKKRTRKNEEEEEKKLTN